MQACESKEFDQVTIRTGPHKELNDAVKPLEGIIENLTYKCAGKLSPLR